MNDMSVNDLNSLPVRGIYGAIRLSLRAREVMRTVRGLSTLTVAAIVLAGLALALRSYWLVALLAVMVLLNAAQWIYFQYYLARSGLDGVDEMTGSEFERWLETFFLRLGFQVERTPYRGDYGADFVLTWNGIRIAVQAKRSSQLVGVQAIQQVVAARAYYGCERTMVVTNSYFTEQAMLLAKKNGVWIRHRDDLAKALARLADR
jgi:restriction system protein